MSGKSIGLSFITTKASGSQHTHTHTHARLKKSGDASRAPTMQSGENQKKGIIGQGWARVLSLKITAFLLVASSRAEAPKKYSGSGLPILTVSQLIYDGYKRSHRIFCRSLPQMTKAAAAVATVCC
jgi:hypothetical protein